MCIYAAHATEGGWERHGFSIKEQFGKTILVYQLEECHRFTYYLDKNSNPIL